MKTSLTEYGDAENPCDWSKVLELEALSKLTLEEGNVRRMTNQQKIINIDRENDGARVGLQLERPVHLMHVGFVCIGRAVVAVDAGVSDHGLEAQVK
jgi:hypothetical protein